jgi:hypothetical protein
MVVAIVLLVVGLAILSIGLAWALGYGPAPGTPLRESFVEAGERVQDGAAEFWEWLRLGR